MIWDPLTTQCNAQWLDQGGIQASIVWLHGGARSSQCSVQCIVPSSWIDRAISLLQYGCLVVNAPTANTVAAAEHGIALLAALSRNVAQADASMKGGKWQRSKYVGVALVDQRLA